ncbi:MAG: aldo/keto reductase [Candidatus Eremiobacteraeota bacterium]|nr:aldo/keto reductase [Candidatus Eremiobacteraeota bacterium]MBV8365881.1 aldo/keto reductase [Candidatus Eremiobacteraeota bacterium]
MRTHLFGSTSRQAPVIGQGTWQISDRGAGAKRSLESLRLGISLGMTHIDTAELYGDAELVVGEAIKGVPRESLFIVSKVLPQNASYNGTIKACKRSLQRIGTDYLDVYLIHWRGRYPLADTLGALEQLVDDGLIRALGVSNFDVEDMEESLAALRRHPIACNQVLYHLEERSIEHAVLPFCLQHDVAVVAYSPFGHGEFLRRGSRGLRVLEEIAARHEATPRQITLAFLTRHEQSFAIPKATGDEHVRENAAAGDVKLTREDVAAIEAAFPLGRRGPLATA